MGQVPRGAFHVKASTRSTGNTSTIVIGSVVARANNDQTLAVVLNALSASPLKWEMGYQNDQSSLPGAQRLIGITAEMGMIC